MEFAEIDQTRLPIIIFRNNPVHAPIQEYVAYLDKQKQIMELALQEGRRLIVIIDLTNLKFMTSEMRIKRGNFIKDNDKLMFDSIAAMYLVAPNIVSRTMLQGIYLVRKPTTPTSIVSSMKEALSLAAPVADKLLAV